jgi:phospholipid/cholesterol/gamma-HCH transport system substrate-binding protein
MRRRILGMSNFRAGLIALVLTALAVFFGFTKGIPGIHHYTVKAMFPSANQLLVGSSVHPGSPVRIAGVEVGQVTSIDRGPGGTALVSMQIDKRGRPVHSDATARIRPRLFLEGNFFVDMTAGSPSAPEIRDGGTIPLSQTAIPVGLNQVLDTFQQSTRGDLKTLLREYAIALDGGGAQALNRSFRYWPGAFRNLAIANEASRGEKVHDVSKLIASAGRTSRALASRSQDLGDLVTAFDHTVAALASRREQLAGALEGLRDLEVSAPPQLRAVDRATGPVRTFSRAVLPALRRSPAVLDEAVPFLKVTGELVAPKALPALVADLRPTVRALATLEPQLDSLFGLVSPVLSCVRDHALPVLQSRVEDGPLTSGQTVFDEILHASGGLVSSSQNFDGNGFTTRYSFGSGQDIVSFGPSAGDQQQLFAFGAVSGSRPAPPASLPPFRPDVPCETQALPDLRAPAQAPVGQKVVGRADASRLAPILDALAGGKGAR